MTRNTQPGHRSGFVAFQQALARQALLDGQLGAARAALRVLRATDFAEGGVAAESHFAVLRDHRSPEEQLLGAVTALLVLTPAVGEEA
jgi:hypothetical protein